MIDWSLAERIGGAIAGQAESAGWVSDGAVADATKRAGAELIEYTGLEPTGELPAGESIARAEWVRVNLRGLRESTALLEEGLERDLELPGPFGELARGAAGRVIGAQAGGILGYASKRVLGQYEIALIGHWRAPRLLFVAPNIKAAGRELGGEGELLDWIALHEVTHALQFGATPWLRDHLGGLVERLITSVDPRSAATRVVAAARSALTTDPRKVIGEIREVGPIGAFLGDEQAALLGRLQGAMSAIEGYAEYVMDEAGAGAGLDVPRLREAMDRRRRGRSPLETLLARVLGLELKLRQYRDGRRFADAVAAQRGIATLNLLFSEPTALPGREELGDPDGWLRRVGA
jgi:coenzyme F420 biosynthesis associated uncharacterized protein